MLKRFNTRFNAEMVIIYPGEFHVCRTCIIATVLGSCISVCIKDTQTGLAGMNHFMLPGDVRSEDIFLSESSRYGIFAMEQLIKKMIEMGAKKAGLEAKIFGGGHVLNFRKTDGNVPESNIEFIKAFLAMEQIPIVASDLGGYHGRKIMFFAQTSKVLLKRLESTVDSKIIQAEKEYKSKIFSEIGKTEKEAWR
ncbi:MAG: chemoreceptor glutamine deamidase CheD [Thermodesulfobacteriota bacterium]|nr:chemoreceptor glutamine deamidase CheD [Thermodesulfobacteriota bacterium]